MRPIADGERERAVATIVAAFADDPVERWMFPELDEYRRHFPEFVFAFGGVAFDTGTAWQTDDLAAVALWLPPGAHAEADAIGRVFAERVAPAKQAEVAAVVARMEELHPDEPHWYLPWLAVDPARQGAGLGSELLAASLERIDAERMPAYLETPNPRTVPFYERHGFEVIGESRAESCPPVTSMRRASAAS